MTTTPFKQISSASLAQAERLLTEWFPRGRRVGKEFLVGNIKGDTGESLKISLTNGHWADFAEGISGYDLIDLCAAMRHSGNRVAAAIELGKKLGITADGKDQHPHRRARAARNNDTDVWQPMVPPPPDAPKPSAQQLRSDMLHEYFDLDDHLLCYVRRFESKGSKGKLFLPLTFGMLNGRQGWHDKVPDSPKPLYRLNALGHAAPDAIVLLCEGEKSADAAQRLFPDHVAMSWMGGALADGGADLAPLEARTVIIWPDADKVGRDAAARLAKRLRKAKILDTRELSDGFDAADLEVQGVGDPLAWLKDRTAPDPYHGLVEQLSVSTWLTRELPTVDRLLGDFITTTTRAFIVGRTGLGKTLLGLAIAMGIAFGTGYLHWRSARPARVLYIDGEMPGELLIQRIRDAARRVKREDLIGNLMVFSTEDAEVIAEQYPMLGMFEPLNTEAGHDFIKRLCGALKPDVVIFDNVQALLKGVQKEEETWLPVLPLVQWLTKQRIGQLWFDHTGHTADRQYGASVKSWRFDALGQMTPLTDNKREPGETAFILSFDPPAGKARRRTPDNWQEFAQHIIRLREDVWTSEPVEKPPGATGPGKVAPTRQPFYQALVAAISRNGTGRPGRTTMANWKQELQRRGLIGPPPESESYRQRDARLRAFRKAKSVLLGAQWIAVEDDTVIDMKAHWA